jgi:hypothetical protein
MVIGVDTNFLQIVVLSGYTQAFLRIRNAFILGFFVTQENNP